MEARVRKIALLGSTGSIGQSTLDVVAASRGQLEIVALTAHRRLDDLCQQARRFAPRFVVATDADAARQHDWSSLPAGTELLVGAEAVVRIAQLPEVDVVLAAVVGSAGLTGTWAALEAGKTVALANKETLVMAGHAPADASQGRNDECPGLLVGAETGRRRDIRRIVLTASGGPFRRWTREQMENATVADALAHPTWQMGPKITIDSATMMNKALEIIEARWLFDWAPEKIDVVIHPQSIVHSLVEYVDGTVLAQMSPPDMKLPIQYALTWPHRQPSPAQKLDWSQALSLDFEPPDEGRFPALALGREVAAAGGTAGAVVNAANEAAVARFLAGEMKFTEIVPACRAVLDAHPFDAAPSLDELLKLDAWARQEISRWILA